ncbi:MAG TPA: alcohol dehydrogenase catalytic domain-containing protein [Verrucomicrobiae bacterium]
MANTNLPTTQYAIQLVGPGQLKLNPAKEIPRPGPRQILAKVECVGLCFSDLKLLKQFDQHPRKSGVVQGLSAEALNEMPNYVPGGKPTVPGHEVTCRIVAVGGEVKHHRVGERCLVQTDYRDLPTAGSNSAFGYNFEGALQEYVLMDERVVIDKSGERFLIPVNEHLAASAVALVEPWACVEDSYVTIERQAIKAGGRLLIVADSPAGISLDGLPCEAGGKPAEVLRKTPAEASTVANESCDDILYFGADKDTLETLNDKLAARGIINVVLGGRKIGAPVNVGVGRVHYGMTRWIGTTGSNPADSYKNIPLTGEIREGDSVVVIGAGGPMGQMHVIRAVCSGIRNISVVGTDMDDARLASIQQKAEPFAAANGVAMRMVNTVKTPLTERFSYFALMAPVPALVASSIRDSKPGCLINLFAGIPAPTKHELDLDTYIANRCFMFGTSGSTIRDMKIVLQKVTSGQLNTNCSVDAISGMAGATAGIAAVENRTLAGKIIVYPMLHDIGLIPLANLHQPFPTVAAKLDRGQWTKAAEDELLRVAGK